LLDWLHLVYLHCDEPIVGLLCKLHQDVELAGEKKRKQQKTLSWQILVREVSFVCHMFQITSFIALKHCMFAGSRSGIRPWISRWLFFCFLLLLLPHCRSRLFAGSRRGIGVNEERDQTLNQLLTELDGFEGREGVLLLAATNRAEVSTITYTSPMPSFVKELFV